jgi:hypothetical protein
MQLQTSHREQLEMILLRRGLGTLAAGRECCADCGRTPLTGEQVHVYRSGPAFAPFASVRRERLVCELCRTARNGPPLASETVQHAERGQTVRLLARAA